MLSHPAFNAVLNALAAVFQIVGYRFIRNKQMAAHRACMMAAFACSTAFLVSYLAYHARVGSVRFAGEGWIRPVYFGLLLSHTVLAAVIVPMVLMTLWRGLRGNYERHRWIARWTLPLWLYVSITGVLIYFLLYHLYAPVSPTTTTSSLLRLLTIGLLDPLAACHV